MEEGLAIARREKTQGRGSGGRTLGRYMVGTLSISLQCTCSVLVWYTTPRPQCKARTIHHPQLLECLHQIHPQDVVVVKLRHSILLPTSFLGSIPRLLTCSDHSMKHTLGNLPDIRLWQSSPQSMSHLIWGGICFSQFNTTMSMMGIVNMSNLLLLVLSQEDSTRVRNGTDGRHSKICWQSGEVVR